MFCWMIKAKMVLVLFWSAILYADGSGISMNKYKNEKDNTSSLWREVFQGDFQPSSQCKNGMVFPLGGGKEKFCLKVCEDDSKCDKGQKCARKLFAQSLCVPTCNTDADCEYPTKCNKDEKYCFWEKCKKHDDCQDSMTCHQPVYFYVKLCSHRYCEKGNDTQCEDNQMCIPRTIGGACQCANGMSGKNCEIADWCKDDGKFKDCKGLNGTCEYNKSLRAVNCICNDGKKIHPEENRCRETCENDDDCKNSGTCEVKGVHKFCSCKLGVFGDKCETVFDCTLDGKYKNCESSGGKCVYNGRKAICECPESQKFNDRLLVCEACICRGGECVIEDGKKVCKCPPGYGNFTDSSCKVCDCGPDTNCIWEAKFGGKKVCLCKPGYSNKNGKCVECYCGPDSSCEFKSDGWLKPEKKVCHCKPGYHEVDGKCNGPCSENPCKNGGTCKDVENGYVCICSSECSEKGCIDKDATISSAGAINASSINATSTMKDCHCGPFSNSCTFDLVCNKLCSCFDGYYQLDGLCVECNCGDKGTCEFEKGRKVCKCDPGFKENNGTCENCNCGGKGTCRFENSQKICDCDAGFMDNDGTCKDCNCGDKGTCRFEKGHKICDCDVGFMENEGKCKDCNCGVKGTCKFEMGKKICDCDRGFENNDGTCKECECGSEGTCRFEKGQKICDCDRGFMENDGTCKECNCGPYGTCSFKHGKKKCNCTSFAIEMSGVCVELRASSSRGTTDSTTTISSTEMDIETTSSSDTTRSSTISTVQPSTQKDIGTTSSSDTTEINTISTQQDCHCGKFSNSCFLDSEGTKVCSCFMGFSQLSESCAECNCGPFGTCSFEYGQKKCICRSFAKERNGVCVDKQDLQKNFQVFIYNFFL